MIGPGYFWLCIGVLAVGTLAIRGSLVGLSSRVKISERTKEIFTYIPAAILPALFVPAAFAHQGVVSWALYKERLLILFLAGLVSYFTRSTLATIGFGLIALYLVTQT